MHIKHIDKAEYTRLIKQGIIELRFMEEYHNDAYFYHLMNGKHEVVFAVYKNRDGLMPVIKLCGSRVYVGYGFSIDIIEQSTLQNCGHHSFCSPVYDLLIESERVIAVTELSIVLFDSFGNIVSIHEFNDIITGYKIHNSRLFISTFDGNSYEIHL